MDDILAAGEDTMILEAAFQATIMAIQTQGLKVAPDKIQRHAPYSYLGFQLHNDKVTLNPPEIDHTQIHTLNHFQKLIGDIQWL